MKKEMLGRSNITCSTSFISSFTPVSAFTSRASTDGRDGLGHGRLRMAAAPKHVKRTEEIKRLTEQLEQLRKKREELLSSKNKANASVKNEEVLVTSNSTEVKEKTEEKEQKTDADVEFKLGKHSSGNRFLSISSVESQEYHPRVLLLAGFVPGLTTKEYMNVPAMLYSKQPDKGNLFLCRLPEDYKGDFITMPTFDILADCGDPVAIIVSSDQISEIKLPTSDLDDDVVLIVDRDMSDFEFNKNDFYVWDVNGTIKIGWSDYLPDSDSDIKCIGKVMYGHIEVDQKLRSKKSCWEEENETYT